MNRREAIKRTSMMLGVAASSPALMSILSGCVPKKTINWKPEFFTEGQATLVADIANVILPKTGSPSAKEVGVDVFIDHIVSTCYSEEEQQNFINGLKEIDKESNLLDGGLFIDLNSEKKVELLTGFENRAARLDVKPEPDTQPFYSQIKELVLLGYFTSEVVMKNYLEYVPIPTRLEGCTEMKPGQKLIVGNHV